MNAIFCSGVASAMKSSTPASRAIVAAVRGLSPVIITVRMPIRRNSSKRSARPSLTVSLSSIRPSARPSLSRMSGVAPRSAIRSAPAAMSAGSPASLRSMASTAPLRTRIPVTSRDPARSRLGPERDRLGDLVGQRGQADVVAGPGGRAELGQAAPGERDDRATLGRRVLDRRDQGRADRVSLGDPGRRGDRRREPIAVGDRAGLVEQDHVDVARTPRPRGRSSRGR